MCMSPTAKLTAAKLSSYRFRKRAGNSGNRAQFCYNAAMNGTWTWDWKSARRLAGQAGVIVFAGGLVHAFLGESGQLISSVSLAMMGILLVIGSTLRRAK